jgi:two-component system OmpR family sensor kinase/two-component system sensor histidine kinase BaeS
MNRLWIRLSLGFSGVVLATAFLIAIIGILIGGWFAHRYRRDDQLQQLEVMSRLAEELATNYQAQQSWTGSEVVLIESETMFEGPMGKRRTYFLADAEGQIIYHAQDRYIGKSLTRVRDEDILPIRLDGQTIGYVGEAPLFRRGVEGPPEPVIFLAGVLLVSAFLVGGGGIVFGVLMSRSLTAPLNNLAAAARAIGTRDLTQRVEEKGSDEMVAVARAFNEMVTNLEQAEQLRRNLLADVAHELRTPLTVLRGNLRAILDDVFPCDDNEIARLYEHTRLLSRLVNDLHELAQAEAKQLPLDLQEIDLMQLITTTSDTFRPGAEAKAVTLETELSDDLPLIQFDAARMRQVLQNLLANALRHTPEGGTITIGAKAGTDILCLNVSDTGEGIPPEHLPHVFDRFYRTDPTRSRDKGGTGLGLAITRAIVEAHGGSITVSSEGVPGKGTTFTIRLPVNQA